MKSAKTVRLGDVCEVVLGGTPSTQNADYWGGGIPWLTPGEMRAIHGRYVEHTERTLTEAGLEAGSRLFPAKSVVLSTRAPIGYVFINTVPMATNQGCKTLVPSTSLLPEYLYYNLLGRTAELNALGTGTTFKELATGALKNLTLPLPPLPVQHAIVARLDSALARAGALEERFAAIAQNAELSFKATLAETFEKVEANKTPFENCCRLLRGTYTTQNAETPGDIPVILGGREPAYYIARSNHDGPCLVVSRSGASAGDISQWNQPIFVTDGFIIEMGDAIDFDYAYFFFKSAQNLLNGLKQGGAIPHVTGTLIKQICIPLPSLATQRSIVSRLDAARKRADGIAVLARQAAEEAANLKKALLKEAF